MSSSTTAGAHDVKPASAIRIVAVSPNNVRDLKVAHASMFSRNRGLNSKKFLKFCASQEGGHSAFVAMRGRKSLGVCSLRREKNPANGNDASSGEVAYIMSLGVYAPCRRKGVATLLMRHVVSVCRAQCSALRLHVEASNAAAVSFYKSVGFVVKETVANYYRRHQDQAALLLSMPLSGTSSIDGGATAHASELDELKGGDGDTGCPDDTASRNEKSQCKVNEAEANSASKMPSSSARSNIKSTAEGDSSDNRQHRLRLAKRKISDFFGTAKKRLP